MKNLKQQIRLKIPTISAVQFFSPELQNFILQSLFYTLGTPSFRTTWESVIRFFLFWLQCVKNLLSFVSLKIKAPALFSYN